MMSISDTPHDFGVHRAPPSAPPKVPFPASPPPGLSAGPSLDIEAMRHPSEPSRFGLLLLASAVAISIGLFVLIVAGRSIEILGFLALVIFAFAVLRLVLLLWRLRLLAEGVRVDAESLPAVQEAIDEVRARLDYHDRVDVVVVDKASRVLTPDAAPVTLTSFFGIRVLVIEGAAIGELSKSPDRTQLIFLLATYFGAIKARHSKWSPLLLALQIIGMPSILFLFFNPWYRATVYTGDRIGYSCCTDLSVSVTSVYQQLVGKEVAPQLRTTGLVQQALQVRRSVLLRLAQLLRPVPHTTNRYLDLLAFVQSRDPSRFGAYARTMGPYRSRLDEALPRLHRSSPSGLTVPVAAVLSVLLLSGGVLGGVWAHARLTPEVGAATAQPAEPVQSANPIRSHDLSANVSSVTAPRTARDGVDNAGKRTSYPASNTMDGDTTTCWRTNGDGSGMELALRLDTSRLITAVGLINGYAKQDPATGANRYLQERRISRVTWTLGAGGSMVQPLTVANPEPQGVSLSTPVTTDVVRLRIDATTPPGQSAYDYTAISEIYLEGQ